MTTKTTTTLTPVTPSAAESAPRAAAEADLEAGPKGRRPNLDERPQRGRWSRRSVGVAILICVATFAVVWAMRDIHWLQPTELRVYDWLMSAQPRDLRERSNIVIVGLDEPDYLKYGYPIPDKALGDAIDKLEKAGAAAIGVDVIRNTPVGDGKGELKAQLENSQNVLWCVSFKAGGKVFIGAPEGLPDGAEGAVELVPDKDDVTRRVLLGSKDPITGKRYSALALQAAQQYLFAAEVGKHMLPDGSVDAKFVEDFFKQFEPPSKGYVITLGGRPVQRLRRDDGPYVDFDASGLQFLPDFKGSRDFPILSLSDLLANKVSPDAIRGKVVLIGSTSPLIKDYVATPITGNAATATPWGVAYHASVVETLIRMARDGAVAQRFWGHGAIFTWTLGWGVAGALMGLLVRRVAAGLGILALGSIALVAVALHLLNARTMWIPVVPPLITWNVTGLGVMLYELHVERKVRRIVEGLFSKTISPQVYDLLWSHRQQLMRDGYLDSSRGLATVLFSDIKGFSGISHELMGQETKLMTWLSEYLAAMARVIESPEHGGIVMNYMGDGIMAVFGAPNYANPDDAAERAVRCALRMRVELDLVRKRWEFLESAKHLKMRIGIHSGPVVDGTLGSGSYLEYSIIGDTVNTAARLESHDKKLMDDDIAALGSRILISDQTLRRVAGKFRTRDVGEHELPGVGCVHIHGVIATSDAAAPVAQVSSTVAMPAGVP